MFKFVVLLASFLGASAFAPVARRATSTSLKMGFESEVGAQPPLGFFDPLGLLADADQAKFDRLRTVEVKHGRIAMLAIVGHLSTTYGFRVPGDVAFGVPYSSMKAGLAAFDTIPFAGLLQVFFFIGLLEVGYDLRKDEIAEESIKYLKANKYDDAAIKRKMAIELNNGRAAQMGILTLMVHEKLDNNPYIINSLLGAPVPFN